MTWIRKNFLRCGLVAASLLCLAAPGTAGADASSTVVSVAAAPHNVPGTTSVVQLAYGGVTRSYRLFVPSKLPAGPRPLLVALHAFTKDAAFMEQDSNLDAGGSKNGVLVAYPEGLNESWNAGTCCGTASAMGVDDVGFIARVIADVAARDSIDRNRIAVVGGSNGAMMAYRFVCERSDLVNVVDVMGGTYVAPSCAFSRPVSLLHVHGLADQVVPFAGVSVSPLDQAGFPAVKGAVGGVAVLDGCSGWLTGPYNGRTDVTLYQAQHCPSGAWVQLAASAPMGHVWSTGPADVAQYGVDMTGMTWGFDLGVWATRAAPAAL